MQVKKIILESFLRERLIFDGSLLVFNYRVYDDVIIIHHYYFKLFKKSVTHKKEDINRLSLNRRDFLIVDLVL